MIVSILSLGVAASVQADIFQWEYINPADPSQGKQQSGILCVDGAGVDAVPAADLAGRNLSMAYLISADLHDAWMNVANLTSADLSQANLTNVQFSETALTNANFAGAQVRGADFGSTTGFTAAQLYSTASYQEGDLSGILLNSNNVSGWNFAGKNLTNADFSFANLTNANFAGAQVQGTWFFGTTGFTAAQLYSTASYQQGDLSGIHLEENDLSGWNFAGKNLRKAGFYFSTLTNTNFAGAQVQGANFVATTAHGFTAPQLYSTASYQQGDLSGIAFSFTNISGWNFAGTNLAHTTFYETTLTGTDLSGTNLTNSKFPYATLTNANFAGADTRGASLVIPVSAITTNLIRPDGHIKGLDLDAGKLLVVRDYHGEMHTDPTYGTPAPLPPIPITVDQHLAMGPGGTLRILFEYDAWDSTISFAPGIPVTLGGTLNLLFANGTDIASQLGRTFDVFDWAGVAPTGTFQIVSPYSWDTSKLYTTGEVTLVPEPTSVALVLSGLCMIYALRRRTTRTVPRVLLCSIASLSIIHSAAQLQAATFQGLGFLPPGGPIGSSAYAVSADGTFVVGASNGHAFRWSQATDMMGLGFGGAATAVSADGSVVVGGTNSSMFGDAIRWTQATGAVDIGQLGFVTNGSLATGVSADGSVVVGSSAHNQDEAFRRTAATGIQGLGFLSTPGAPSGGESRAHGTSADGSVVVGWSNGTAIRWTAQGGMAPLSTAPEWQSSVVAYAVTPNGDFVVGGKESADGSVAFRWSAVTGLVQIGELGSAFATSADGSTVVGYDPTGILGSAMLWTEAQGARLLSDILVNDYGLDLHDWSLDGATGISADGQTIVGFGWHYSPGARFEVARLIFHLSGGPVFWRQSGG